MTTQNNYDDLDFCLNTMFDFYYKKSEDTCYIFKPILKNAIKMIDLKKDNTYDYTNIFTGKFSFMLTHNKKPSWKRTSDSTYPCTITIGRYDRYSTTNMKSPQLINMAMMYLCSEIMSTDNLKHIILPVMMFDIKGKDLINVFPEVNKEITNIKETDMLFVQITEHFFSMMSLKDYIKQNIKNMKLIHWKVLFFQVLYTLAKLSERMTKFRHNMLNLESIMIYVKNEIAEPTTYKLGKNVFVVPNVGFDIKIWDFDMSFTSNYDQLIDLNLKNDNPYYDIHYFFNSLYLFLKDIYFVPEEIMVFIEDMIPAKFRTEPGNTFNGLDEIYFDSVSSNIILPALVLKKNKFLNEFLFSENSE